MAITAYCIFGVPLERSEKILNILIENLTGKQVIDVKQVANELVIDLNLDTNEILITGFYIAHILKSCEVNEHEN